jgi:large repetitive protein
MHRRLSLALLPLVFVSILAAACSSAGTNIDIPSDAGCSPTCAEAGGGVCGNGAIEPGEQCDDGNVKDGDGCSAACAKETAPPSGVPEVTCKTLAPIAAGTCAVTAGSAAKLIVGTVLTSEKTYRGGAVLVDDKGSIACVGCDCEAQAQALVPAATTITCPDGVVSAALINPHDHITYAQNNPYKDTGERYEHRHDWRSGKNGHTKITTPGGATPDQIRWAELRFLMSGATSTVGSGSVAGLLRNLDKAADEIGLAQKPVDFETFPLGDSNSTQLASGCGYPAIRTVASIAGDDAFLPHVAEGIGDFAKNEFTCLSTTTGGGQDLVAPKTAMIHSIGLTAADYADIGQRGGSVIWSPRSNITLYGDTAEVPEAARLGVRIALGTDWIATGSMNLARELKCADSFNKTYFGGYFSDVALWRMVTVDAAHATATDDVIGDLVVGKVGDVAIFGGKVHKDHRAIIDAAPQDVVMVMRAGKVLYGDDSAVGTATTAACDALDVCGTPKRVCLQDEFGKNLAALQTAAGANIYPAFFCDTPTNEPSCTPTRPKSVSGSTVYTGVPSATDADGDGIPDASDNCPKVFNPIRPMDGGKQTDADGDGNGDACDVCPLDANTTTCKIFDPNDSDGDGVANGTDNCPTVANTDQADADSDGKGDACDACPKTANPGALACPATIYDVKKGTVPAGTSVSISNTLVTGKAATGFYLQAKTGDPGYAGTDYSGIFVFQTANTVNVGDRVTVTSATVAVFGGETELTAPAVTVVTSASETAPDPVVVTPSDVVTGGPKAAALEGVVVQVNAVTVTDAAPAAGAGDTAPTNEFAVDAALRINDLLYLTAPFPTVGMLFTSITGVLDFKNGNSKIEPRAAGDVVLGPAQLSAFNEPSSFARVGQTAAATLPVPLTVSLTSAPTADTFVAIAPSDAASLTVAGGGATVLAGQTSATVLVSGLQQAASVTLTATLGAQTRTATVRVVAAAEVPVLTSLTPPTLVLAPGGTTTFTVGLDIPAPAGGTAITLALAPANAGTIPATVTVAADQTTATFAYADASTATTATVNATLGITTLSATLTLQVAAGGLVINEVDYDNVGTDTAEFVEIYNGSAAAIDLTGFSLLLVNGANNAVYKTVDLGAAGTLAPGQYLVVGATSVVAATGALKIDLGALTDIIQNGSPDGVALVDTQANKLIDALSYEGAITAAVIPGVGTVSLVEGTALPASVADSNTAAGSLCRLPNGTDTNNAATDWKLSSAATPGAANVN